jgi:hypothetical protein
MTNKFQALEDALNGMVGAGCWSVMVPGGLENGLTLSLGDKVPRPAPLNAPNLTAEQQAFWGAYELIIADCTWRLDSPDVIVTSWSDDAPAQRERLAHLIGTVIGAWEITWPGLDLSLHFDNALSLRLFCDQTDPQDSGHNYSLLAPGLQFYVGVRSELSTQKR